MGMREWLRSIYCCRRHDLQGHDAGLCTNDEKELIKLGLLVKPKPAKVKEWHSSKESKPTS